MCISEQRLKLFLDGLAAFDNDSIITTAITREDFDFVRDSLIRCRELAVAKLESAITKLKGNDELNPALLGVSLLRVLHGTGLREVAHTRLLTWLMNPDEDHGFSIFLLQTFLSHIADGKWASDKTLKVTCIQAERKLSNNNKRIDIWIEGTVRPSDDITEHKWLVIIEAKVDSSESDGQLDAYKSEADMWFNKNTKIKPLLVFLTRGNDKEQANSDEAGEAWTSLSFKKLSELLWNSAKQNGKLDAPGIHMLRYYIAGILADVYGWNLPITHDKCASSKIYEKLNFLKSHQISTPNTKAPDNSPMKPSDRTLAIGNELKFYATFPEEMDLLVERDEEGNGVPSEHFDFLGQNLLTLVKKSRVIALHATEQAKVIIDGYAEKIKTITAIKIQRIKNQGEWVCKFKCSPNIGEAPSKRNLVFGLRICTIDNKLIALSWLWVRGVERYQIIKILNQGNENSLFVDVTPNERGWERTEFCFISENLLDIAKSKESLEDMINRLAKPILSISDKAWNELFKLSTKQG
jgi:hypothetical protein